MINEENKKNLLLWPDSGITAKTRKVNAPYHFIHFGEVISYLTNNVEGNIFGIDQEAIQCEFDYIVKKIIKNEYETVAIYLNTENLQNGLRLLEIIKSINPKTKSIAYGEVPLYLPLFFKSTSFDAIVNRGCDQEASLLNFIYYCYSNDEKYVNGFSIIKNNQLLLNNSIIKVNPSDWEFTDERLVPIRNYFEMEGKEQFVFTLSRGCPYNCPYCNAVLYYGQNERRRNVTDIIDFINSHNYDTYKFFAPNFTLNEKECLKLCRALINNKKRINWSCTTRPDLLQNEKLLELMAMAGCRQIAVGIESVCQEDLENINKRYDKGYIIQGMNNLRKYNIEYKALIMFGVPNQTKESILYTLDFLYSNNVVVRATAYTPFQDLNHNMTAEQLSKYDKRTYYEGIPGLSYGDFLRLIYDTMSYKEILKGSDKSVYKIKKSYTTIN